MFNHVLSLNIYNEYHQSKILLGYLSTRESSSSMLITRRVASGIRIVTRGSRTSMKTSMSDSIMLSFSIIEDFNSSPPMDFILLLYV